MGSKRREEKKRITKLDLDDYDSDDISTFNYANCRFCMYASNSSGKYTKSAKK